MGMRTRAHARNRPCAETQHCPPAICIPGRFDQSVLEAIDYFNEVGGGGLTTDGGLTVFAAGNENDDGRWYPAYYSGAIAVAGSAAALAHPRFTCRIPFSSFHTSWF
eukprot:6213254-Pleurochrysis_carterae.AAC.2